MSIYNYFKIIEKQYVFWFFVVFLVLFLGGLPYGISQAIIFLVPMLVSGVGVIFLLNSYRKIQEPTWAIVKLMLDCPEECIQKETVKRLDGQVREDVTYRYSGVFLGLNWRVYDDHDIFNHEEQEVLSNTLRKQYQYLNKNQLTERQMLRNVRRNQIIDNLRSENE